MKKQKINLFIQCTLRWALALLFVFAGKVYAQEATLTLDMKNASLSTIFDEIEKQTGYTFFYAKEIIDVNKKVNISVKGTSIAKVLEQLLSGTNVAYSISGKHIILSKRLTLSVEEKTDTEPNTVPANTSKKDTVPQTGTTPRQTTVNVQGVVFDDVNLPLPGAAVHVKGNPRKYATTDAEGKFELKNISPNDVLQISFLGFVSQEIKVNGRTTFSISLKSDVKQLEEVVVIGNIERKRESFTGTTATVTGADLKQIGTQNLVESLKSLDPSFVVLDNNLSGADPNVMPNIEIRGTTSIEIDDLEDRFRTDPNQPLFILNGFETTLQKIIDLDFNRVASVTILKDAASTAMYGSRAANGVVVVETIKGNPGRYKLFYTGDFSVQVPDLTSYNMMNAREKLEFEVLSGRYKFSKTDYPAGAQSQMDLTTLYYKHLAEVQRGVDTYWLSEPVQTAFINRQSVRISGGSNEMTVDANLSYRNAPGVMKGSKRNSWSGGVDLGFHKGQISFINFLSISGYTGVNSPYGSFSNYANANPYYRKTNEDGEYQKYLEVVMGNSGDTQYKIPNPLYNAMLNSKSESDNLSVSNNFQAIWRMYKGMKLEGSLRLNIDRSSEVMFTPPENTIYDETPADKKGLYTSGNGKNFIYQGRLMYQWNNSIKRHNYTVNVQGEIENTNFQYELLAAQGYPYGTNGNPIFANSYVQESRPEFSKSVFRRVNLLASGNYSFDNRYLFDISYRIDGSTAFGSARKYTPFWGIGVGWNLHKEAFMETDGWLSLLRLRANIGETGKQNVGQVLSTQVYSYVPGMSKFGIATILTGLGNPEIEWEKTLMTSFNMDLNLFKDRFRSEFSVYRKFTNPLIVPLDMPPSTGTTSYSTNMGDLTVNGFEFKLSYAIIQQSERRINWNVRLQGSLLESIYGGFADQLENMNKKAEGSGSENLNRALRRYRDGYSNRDLWAVRSLGIDPATGQELFLDKNNQPTFRYDPSDVAVVGNSNPDIYGTIASYFTFKQLSFNFTLRYSLGGEIFNSALYNKVENISFAQVIYNQDKRALYERWQKPGDIAQFKAISLTSSTPMSSRFVQTENYLSGESVNIGYRFDKSGWIRYLGLEQLNINAYMNSFFRLSNVKSERGTAYPFVRSFSFSVSAVF